MDISKDLNGIYRAHLLLYRSYIDPACSTLGLSISKVEILKL